jgi:hypothetical protein
MKLLNWALLVLVIFGLGLAIWRTTPQGKVQNSGMDVQSMNTALMVVLVLFGGYIVFNMMKK